MSRTPNYVTTMEFVIHPTGGGRLSAKDITLPAGSSVRPIEADYVPAHVLDADQNKYFDKKSEIFAYTKFGIVKLPRSGIREN